VLLRNISACDTSGSGITQVEFSQVHERIDAARIEAETAARNGLAVMPHLRWELEQVMTRVRPTDLSVVEIAALLVILRLAHTRVIGEPVRRPEAHVVAAGFSESG
jgi:hypothetical protein